MEIKVSNSEISQNLTLNSGDNHPKFQNSLKESTFSQNNCRKFTTFLTISIYATGFFALIGALYRWGEGSLFNAPENSNLTIYLADIILAAPVSFLSAYCMSKYPHWGIIFGNITAGIYLYGSAMVYISIIQNIFDPALKLIIPPIFGICLSIAIIYWSILLLKDVKIQF